ncbi:MAG: uroporphyrinogen-III C-methyltransferase [Bacteroidetes bacterium]|nr:uroporphyrinogen-III C-methyltransferase [Bacteroidota bacterium]
MNRGCDGKVILAAAGCGDPELITVKAARFLREADVVLTDRLVSEAILKTYVREGVPVVHVGKQYNRSASIQQQSINQMLLFYASQYKLVVRLKGGDVSFFSNILDELETLTANEVPFEIIPGVTAASGAAAYAGIPLTARGYATSVRFLTSYKKDVVTDAYWKELAETKDTLVFYMSSETVGNVVHQLIQHNIDAAKLLAVVEQATTPMQQVSVCSLYDYDQKLKGKTFASPSLVIIGKVVALHEQFAWHETSNYHQLYFKPVI